MDYIACCIHTPAIFWINHNNNQWLDCLEGLAILGHNKNTDHHKRWIPFWSIQGQTMHYLKFVGKNFKLIAYVMAITVLSLEAVYLTRRCSWGQMSGPVISAKVATLDGRHLVHH